MPNNEYLKAVTIGSVTKLDGKITLCEYDGAWAEQFRRARDRIAAALGGQAVSVEHVGSTSVPGLCAKPVLDILLLVPDSRDEAAYVPALEALGYALKIREADWYAHRMLKGFDPETNLHVFSVGCDEAERMLSFRDWLRIHAEDREKYAAAKRALAERTWKYMQNYADAKSEVVAEILRHMQSAAAFPGKVP